MIKIKTNTELTNFKGKPIEDSSEEGTMITVGKIIFNVLAGSRVNVHRSYLLGKKIAENDVVELKAEDWVFIKERLEESGKQEGGATALFTGQVIYLMESPEEDTK